MIRIATSLFLLCLVFSCSDPKKNKTEKAGNGEPQRSDAFVKLQSGDDPLKLICQNWKLTDAKPPLPKDLGDFGETSHGDPALYILNDNTIIENPLGDNIRTGNFSFKDNTIDVSFNDGKKNQYIIKKILPESLSLRRIENGKETLLTLISEGYGYRNVKDNPFHPEYSGWRFKPKAAEDDEALKDRLRNYMEFYYKYFQDFLNRDAQTMEFGKLPCCFNWYKGGLTIQSEKNLDNNWINCFYSKEQALKARDILEKALLKKHKWIPDVPNWVEQTAPILKSIRDSI